MPVKKFIKVRILGSVQGVGFRFFAKDRAEELDLKGFAQNEPNGSVYMEAEGEEKNLNKLLEWCHSGPPFAKVQKVDSELSDLLKNFTEFEIR